MRTSRRRFLKAGLYGGLLVAAGSLVAVVRTRGYRISDERRASLIALSPWHVVVVEHAARRIAARDDERDAALPSADDVDVVGFVDSYVAALPDDMRRDLFRFFAVLEHLAPVGLGMAGRFSRLGPVDQDRVLASLEAHREPLLRGGFQGLKSLVFMGYYRDPRTWAILDYRGPWIGRPARGWWP